MTDRLIISIRVIEGSNCHQKDITIDIKEPPSEETLLGLMENTFESTQEVLAIVWPTEFPLSKG